MKDYYDLFIELSLQQCSKIDYSNKEKVKIHNSASKKLRKLQEEMKHSLSEEMLCKLLRHEDDRVKINAAYFCLRSEILIEQANLTLKKVVEASDDPTLCFTAKMLLEYR